MTKVVIQNDNIQEVNKEISKLKIQQESLQNEKEYILMNFQATRMRLNDLENSKGHKILEFFRKIIRKILKRS